MMYNKMRNLGLAATLAVAAAGLLPSQASALSMAECSVKFGAAKAAQPGVKLNWNEFRKAQCSADAVPTAPAATTAKAPAAPAATTAKAPAPTAPAAATSGNFMKECGAAWKAMKTANTVPAGMSFQDFVAAKCQVAAAPVAPPAKGASTAPAATAGKASPPAAPATTAAGAMVDKNGKPMSPGRAAMVMRERACGAEWKAAKAANKIPIGQTWPQYWSACNTRLKAAGQ